MVFADPCYDPPGKISPVEEGFHLSLEAPDFIDIFFSIPFQVKINFKTLSTFGKSQLLLIFLNKMFNCNFFI